MDKQKIDEYKKRLERERLLLLAEVKQDEKPVDFGSDEDHFEEEADEAEEMENQFAAAAGLKKRLDEIDIALSKIAEGIYGKCGVCKKDIEHDVLEIAPESLYCKTHKAEK